MVWQVTFFSPLARVCITSFTLPGSLRVFSLIWMAIWGKYALQIRDQSWALTEQDMSSVWGALWVLHAEQGHITAFQAHLQEHSRSLLSNPSKNGLISQRWNTRGPAIALSQPLVGKKTLHTAGTFSRNLPYTAFGTYCYFISLRIV